MIKIGDFGTKYLGFGLLNLINLNNLNLCLYILVFIEN